MPIRNWLQAMDGRKSSNSNGVGAPSGSLGLPKRLTQASAEIDHMRFDLTSAHGRSWLSTTHAC